MPYSEYDYTTIQPQYGNITSCLVVGVLAFVGFIVMCLLAK